MTDIGNLIDFDVIEGQKENIQSLPSGRSAKKLAELYAPSPLYKLSTPTPQDSRNLNDSVRAGFEAELANITESDDPLDIFDRYTRWTLDTYPSAQATPQSQLHTLLERATKAFISSPQYRNDTRYLKLWMLYVRFFVDTPRETFIFLSRHGIGDGLALFYEEYSAWLESAGRWAQAEEVYKAGIERDARPAARLLRKYAEFEQRRDLQPAGDPNASPPSPALPTVRPALAAKLNPFAPPVGDASDPQRQSAAAGASRLSSTTRLSKPKLAVFSDADAGPGQPSALGSRGPDSKGWHSLGSLAERKKENTMEAKPWAGETLAAGAQRRAEVPKMAVFRDPNLVISPSENQIMVHPHTGKIERVFVDLQTVYPTPEISGSELSFEEIWAANRGWADCRWDDQVEVEPVIEPPDGNILSSHPDPLADEDLLRREEGELLDENGAVREDARELRRRKMRVLEINETQIIKAKLDSPSGPKIKKKNTTEPTMTMHTKAATEEIYEIFGQSLNSRAGRPDDEGEDEEDEGDGDGDDYETDGDGDYTSGVESTGTSRQLSTSEAGDEEEIEVVEEGDDDDASDVKSVSEWSDFTARKHVPKVVELSLGEAGGSDSTEATGTLSERTSSVDDHFDGVEVPPEVDVSEEHRVTTPESRQEEEEEERAREKEREKSQDEYSAKARTAFLPKLPEDCDPPTRPYRDAAEMANNRLPFMTPITERTESSLSVEPNRRESFQTPSRRDGGMVAAPSLLPRLSLDQNSSSPVLYSDLSSPVGDVPLGDGQSVLPPLPPPPPPPPPRKPLALLQKRIAAAASKTVGPRVAGRREPVIKDMQCNPVDEGVRADILASLRPALSSYAGFFDRRDQDCDKAAEIRRFLKGQTEKPVVLELADAQVRYTIRRELGTGAFAPVYLVERERLGAEEEEETEKGTETRQRGRLEALKMETPASAWEFYMMRLAHARLGPHDRATASLSAAHELHLFRDAGLLVLQYHPHGTLLDVVNMFRAEPPGAMDEVLAMFFTVELLRTVEALHAHGLMHGDVKADNCMLRLGGDGGELMGPYRADGGDGWSGRGVSLIDLGRGVDMGSFAAGVQFVADWKPAAQDCPEMREGRPWTWQMDYYGLAGVAHCLLFGRYMDAVPADPAAAPGPLPRRYRLRDGLKRYWQTDIWSDCFDALLNPAAAAAAAEDGGKMPLLRTMRRVRSRMEAFLEQHGERGVGLRALLARVEAHAMGRR